jgi:hypothetical protein
MNLPSNEPLKVGTSGFSKKMSIDGQDFKRLFNAGIAWVKSNQQTINSLNVFPVPDGDTGTNMFLTLKSAYGEVADSHESNIGKIAHQISQGALMGARGNSGVILSQLLRGFARVLDDQQVMDGALFVRALHESRNTAYKGVVIPVEGTILTVAKDIAKAAEDALQISPILAEMLEIIVREADKSVKNTPELLPILKQAGVVDSGVTCHRWPWKKWQTLKRISNPGRIMKSWWISLPPIHLICPGSILSYPRLELPSNWVRAKICIECISMSPQKTNFAQLNM